MAPNMAPDGGEHHDGARRVHREGQGQQDGDPRRGAEAGHDADDHPTSSTSMARYRRLTGDSATEKP